MIIGLRCSSSPSADASSAHNLADEGISPGLVLCGQGRNTRNRIVQALSITSSLIGMSQYGLNIEHNIWIGSSQRQADARQAFAQAAWIQLKPIAQTDGLVDTHEVVIWPMRAGCQIGRAHV